MSFFLQAVFFGAAVPVVCVVVCCALLAVSNPDSLLTSCVSMTAAVCATHMLLHRWEDSPRRYQILAILSMPAVYACLTGLQQLVPQQALHLGVCAEIYEGLGLVTFLLLLRSLAGAGASEGSPGLRARAGASRWGCGAPSYECMAATLPVYKIAFLIVSTVDATSGLDLGYALSRADLLCSFCLGCVALTAIGRLLAHFTESLGSSALLLKHKFWAVKGIVTVMFNQSLLLWALDRPLQRLLDLLEMEAREDFVATLVAMEMLFLSLWHTVAFPVSGDSAAAAPGGRQRALLAGSGAASSSGEGDWLWPWMVAQMTVLAACLLVGGIDRVYHVWFVLGCALCILVAFGCRCMRPLRRMVVVGAVAYIYAVYLVALGRKSSQSRCEQDAVPLSAGGLAQSSFNCSAQEQRGSCGELWLQGFCCESCGPVSCPHCGVDATARAAARQHDVLLGACMALTAAALTVLVRIGYVVLDCGGGHARGRALGGGGDGRAGAEEYVCYESDVELPNKGIFTLAD